MLAMLKMLWSFLEGEKILDEAKLCVINSLKDTFSLSSMNKDLLSDNVDAERMVHSLELPSHWSTVV